MFEAFSIIWIKVDKDFAAPKRVVLPASSDTHSHLSYAVAFGDGAASKHGGACWSGWKPIFFFQSVSKQSPTQLLIPTQSRVQEYTVGHRKLSSCDSTYLDWQKQTLQNFTIDWSMVPVSLQVSWFNPQARCPFYYFSPVKFRKRHEKLGVVSRCLTISGSILINRLLSCSLYSFFCHIFIYKMVSHLQDEEAQSLYNLFLMAFSCYNVNLNFFCLSRLYNLDVILQSNCCCCNSGAPWIQSPWKGV